MGQLVNDDGVQQWYGKKKKSEGIMQQKIKETHVICSPGKASQNPLEARNSNCCCRAESIVEHFKHTMERKAIPSAASFGYDLYNLGPLQRSNGNMNGICAIFTHEWASDWSGKGWAWMSKSGYTKNGLNGQ